MTKPGHTQGGHCRGMWLRPNPGTQQYCWVDEEVVVAKGENQRRSRKP